MKKVSSHEGGVHYVGRDDGELPATSILHCLRNIHPSVWLSKNPIPEIFWMLSHAQGLRQRQKTYDKILFIFVPPKIGTRIASIDTTIICGLVQFSASSESRDLCEKHAANAYRATYMIFQVVGIGGVLGNRMFIHRPHVFETAHQVGLDIHRKPSQ